MEITAEMVRNLREKTGAGMMKCKEALIECKGNSEDAVDLLRKKGLASADKKAGRDASQGLVTAVVSEDRTKAAIIEINCETDFVARNENFKQLSKTIAEYVLAHPKVKTVEELANEKLSTGQTIDEVRKALVTKTGENMSIRRIERMEVSAGCHGMFDAYIHGEGGLGVLALVECANADGAKHEDLKTFVHDVALQVAAMKPWFVRREEVPQDVLAREKDVVLGQIKNDPKNANKPENIMLKIVEGRIGKFYEERCLLEQVSIRDEEKVKKIADVAAEVGKKLGGDVKIVSFRRWAIGEAPAA